MKPIYLKTTAVARLLGVPYLKIWNLIRFDKLKPPGRDSSGHYVWTSKDIKVAAAALGVKVPKE